MKKVLTEEEKKARAAKMRAAKEAKKVVQEAVETKNDETVHAADEKPAEVNAEPKAGYSAEEVQKMVAEAVAQAMSNMPKEETTKTIIREVGPDTERVYFLWQADVSPENVESFGPNAIYGTLTGATGTIMVPKNELSQFLDEKNRRHLDRRWLIVVSGLDEDELKAYGCDYKEGEILDKGAFYKLLDIGDELLDIFPKLCKGHKEMVARRFVEAYMADDARAKDRSLIVKLNNFSKEEYKDLPATDSRRKGAFWPIIEAMNDADGEID